MSKPLNARVKIIRRPAANGGTEEPFELIIDESELQEGDEIIEYLD